MSGRGLHLVQFGEDIGQADADGGAIAQALLLRDFNSVCSVE